MIHYIDVRVCVKSLAGRFNQCKNAIPTITFDPENMHTPTSALAADKAVTQISKLCYVACGHVSFECVRVGPANLGAPRVSPIRMKFCAQSTD